MNKASEEGEVGIVACGWTLLVVGLLLGFGAFSFASFVSGSLDPPGHLFSPQEEVLGKWQPVLNQTDGSLR